MVQINSYEFGGVGVGFLDGDVCFVLLKQSIRRACLRSAFQQ